MARKYYVDVVGTIGSGGLTNVATTHTFTAPLTYANGITLPTLAAGDSFLLSIKDSTTGRVTEVVEVAAYNQGTGVATIVRGAESTTGVAHASGDKVTLSTYPSDLTSGLLKRAALHPTYGDHFTGTSLNAKWSRAGAYVSGDETYAQGPVSSLLQVAPRSGGESGGSYYYQTVSGLTDFTLEMRAFLIGGNSNYFPALVAFDSSSDGVSGCWHTLNFTAVQTQPVSDGVITGSGFTIGDARWSDHLTNGGLPFHVQLNRTGTAWKTRGSFGEVWTPWTATLTDSRTITRIGFSPTVYTDVPHAFYIDYFDVY